MTEAGLIWKKKGLGSSGRAPASDWPRITLVTAVYNGEHCLEETIESILAQNYPNLDYIIVNDGSTDGTANIIRRYERHLTTWFTQSNQGLYAALNAGYARSDGEIMGWLNASDKLHTGALFVVGSVFKSFPNVEWITGRPTMFSDDGMTIRIGEVPDWHRWRFLLFGAHDHLEQESTFWRRSLWEKAGGALSTAYRAEGDFELWTRFFRHAPLYPVDALIGGWRFHPKSLSHDNVNLYNENCHRIAEAELRNIPEAKSLQRVTRMDNVIQRIPKVRRVWKRLFLDQFYRRLYRKPGWESVPAIEYDLDSHQWRIRRS